MRFNSIKRDTSYQSVEYLKSSDKINMIIWGTAWLSKVRVVRCFFLANGRNPSIQVSSNSNVIILNLRWSTLSLHDLFDWATLVLH